MTISLGNAITRVKEEPKWLKKILILGALFIGVQIAYGILAGMFGLTPEAMETNPATMFLFTITSFLVLLPITAYYTGFIFQSMHKTFNSDKFQMVELSQKNLLIDGLKNVFSVIGYSILLEIILFVFLIAYILVIALFGVLISLILSALISAEAVSIFIVILGTLAGLVFGLYFAQFINAAFACYLKTLKFADLIAFNKHFQIIKENKHTSWTLIGKNILYSLLFLTVILVLCITLIGVILIPFVTIYAYFVAFNLLDQYSKEIKIERYL